MLLDQAKDGRSGDRLGHAGNAKSRGGGDDLARNGIGVSEGAGGDEMARSGDRERQARHGPFLHEGNDESADGAGIGVVGGSLASCACR